MYLHYPQTIPYTLSDKTGPWCQKGWGPLLYTIFMATDFKFSIRLIS